MFDGLEMIGAGNPSKAGCFPRLLFQEAGNMVNCGRELRITIAARGLTDKDVARRANIHPSRLSRILRGREPLSQAAGRKIIQAIYPELFPVPEAEGGSHAG